MKRKIRIKRQPSLAMACTGGHLPDPPRLGQPVVRVPVDETGRPLNMATGPDVDRLVGLNKRGYAVPRNSPGDITKGARLTRDAEDPPDPYGPDGDRVAPEPREADALRDRYGLDDEGYPLPAHEVTEEQRMARAHATITGPRQ
jgi:hypothetical protein